MAYLVKFRKKWNSDIETEKAKDSQDLERVLIKIGKTVHKSVVKSKECTK